MTYGTHLNWKTYELVQRYQTMFSHLKIIVLFVAVA